MMKKFLFVLTVVAATFCLSAPAYAACAVTNLQVKDNAAVTAAVPYADDGSGASNCAPQIQIKQGGNVAAVGSNASSAVATSSTNLASIAYMYGFNGTTWDQLQVDGSKFLKVVFGSTQNIGTVTTVTSITNPVSVNSFTSWGGGTLGAMANYGTSPGAVLVPGVNAFVTNANANGAATAANSSPVTMAVDQGASTTGNIVANNTTAVVVNAAATTLYSVQLGGIGSAPAYLKLYNATSATCGSGTPVKRLIIPAAPTAANGAGSNVTFPLGLRFSTGLTYCVTTGIGDADTTAPAASTYLVNLDWR